jgi:hypothetical protein
MSGLKKNDLPDYLQTHSNKSFKWGTHDCITFTVGWIEQQTGRDYLTEHRPWRSAKEAHKKLRALSGLFFLFDKNLTRISPNMARDGDLTIYENTAYLFSGRHIVSVGPDGLVFVDRMIASCAWRF